MKSTRYVTNSCRFHQPTSYWAAGLLQGWWFLLLMGMSHQGLSQCFQPATAFGMGNNPCYVVVGDVNGDGKTDLVTANLFSNSVSVLLGQGNGAFSPATSFGVGNNPYSVGIGDVNGDGKADLVTANWGSNTVSVLLGQGNGTFSPATSFEVGRDPVSVVVGDVNGDGKTDLVTANANSNTVSVLLGQGNGTFSPATSFGVGDNPYSVGIGDVNGDGKADLVTANYYSNTVSVLLGQGNGTFSPATSFGVGNHPHSVAVGDVNGDGKTDLVTANVGSNTVSVLLGQGNGTFSPATSFGVGYPPVSVGIGDVNGDGKADLVTANFGGNTVSVLLGQGNGTFSPATGFGVGDNPNSVAVGDFNGDGKADLVTANWGSNTVSVLLYNQPVAITGQPSSGSNVTEGEGVTASVQVNGSGPITYQWYKDGVPLTGVASAITATLSLPTTATANSGSYSVIITNTCNRVTSSAFVLIVHPTLPSLASLTPTHGSTAGGAILTLLGANLGNQTGSLQLGSTQLTPILWTANQIQVRLSPGQGLDLPLVITRADGQTSSGLSFSYDAPSLIGITPASGPTAGNTQFTLTGSNFGLSPSVTIGGRSAPLISNAHTQLVVISPPSQAGAQPVVVTVGRQTSNSLLFTYVAPAPNLTDVWPTHGPTLGNTTLTLSGTNFGSVAGRVMVGGVAALITSWSDLRVQCTLPAGQGDNLPLVLISLILADGQMSSNVTFSYDAPVLMGITPASGSTAGNTQIRLTGSNFGLSAQVTIGGQLAPITLQTQLQLIVTSPEGQAGEQPVVVSVGGQTSNALSFTYVAPAPSLTDFTAYHGPTAGGTTLTLRGVNFGSSGYVTIGGQIAPGVAGTWTDTQLQCRLPAGQGTDLPVVVTRSDGQHVGGLFSYDAPVLTNINPASGLTGGAQLTLSGNNFGLASNVIIGGLPAGISFQSHSLLVVTSPVGLAGPQSVVVTAGGQHSNALSLTYVAPVGMASVKVQALDGDNGQLGNNTINPTLRLVNSGTVAVPYSEFTLRYWFTAEHYAGLNTWIDYAQIGTNWVKMKYVRLDKPYQGADGYIEYSFDASAGNLSASANSGPIQSRFANQNWAVFNEGDDYSYQSGSAYLDNTRITLYRTIGSGQAQLIWGTEPEADIPVMKFTVQSQNKNSTTSPTQLSTYLTLNNTGNVPVNYSDVTMRYWFTAEGTTTLTSWIDYAEPGASNLLGQFTRLTPARSGADTYLEFGFKSSAGLFSAMGSTGSIQFRAAKADWSAFNEANDYSFRPSGSLAENNRITLYYKGQLVYGAEPPSGLRQGAESREPVSSLQVLVLSNPIQGDQADFEIRGAEGQPLQFQLTDVQGRIVADEHLESAADVERHHLLLRGNSAGMFILRVSSGQESKTVKLLHVNE